MRTRVPKITKFRLGQKSVLRNTDNTFGIIDGGLASWGKVTASEIRGSDMQPPESGICKDQGRRM